MAFARGGPLLERERELETLRDGVGRACAGEGTLLLIEGPAGAGKTVLAREACAVAERARMMPSRPTTAALYPRPLSASAAVTLTRERLGADAAEEFCRACHTATGGNPLFLRELLRALAAAEVAPSATAANAIQNVGPAVVSRFVLHWLLRSVPRRSSWRERSPCSEMTASRCWPAGCQA